LAADRIVHAGNVFIGRGATGADGPYGFIGDDDIVLAGGIGNGAGELGGDDGFGAPPSRSASVSPTQMMGLRPAPIAASALARTISSVSP